MSGYADLSRAAYISPNDLMNSTRVNYNPQELQLRNQLLEQDTQVNQQTLDKGGIEYFSRAATSLAAVGKPGEEGEAERAAAYPAAVAMLPPSLRARAPAQYPGWGGLQRAIALGTSSEKLGERQASQTAKTGLLPTDGTAAGGGGTASLTPFVARNLPPGITPEEDLLVRTASGEAADQGPVGQQAVAAVILNRMRESGRSASDVIFAANQFEPWNNPATRAKLEAMDPNSREYQTILANIRANQADPTGGATHFYSPRAQQALGRQPPSWGNAVPSAVIGGHNFYRIGYRPGGGTPVTPGQPQTPGGSTPPPGVQMGGAPPGPPGGAPGPYSGGGFGTALNPTAPTAPVARTPPAPGGGTASNVGGDVNAMLAGINRAQTTPMGGVMAAGPAAPTAPERQVASVELPPQPGWGTAVGSYGDGAASAPAAPTAPAQQPAVPVAPRSALPDLPPPPRAPETRSHGYTDEQVAKQRVWANDPGISTAKMAELQAAQLTANAAAREKAYTDQMAYVRELRERANQVELSSQRATTLRNQAETAQRDLEKMALDRQRFEFDKSTRNLPPGQERDPKTGEVRDMPGARPTPPTGYHYTGPTGTATAFDPGGPADPATLAAQAKARGEGGRPMPSVERTKLISTAGQIDEMGTLANNFRDYGGSMTAGLGDIENYVARNLSIGNVPAAEWWQQYQRQKIAARQLISGQSLTSTEKNEYEKADINPGMSNDIIRKNLDRQQTILMRGRDRLVLAMAAEGYNPAALEEASGVRLEDAKSRTSKDVIAGQSKPGTGDGWSVKRLD